MRRLATTLLATCVLIAPASALAANATVSIENTDYNPAVVTITPGASVTWHYTNDTLQPHGVQFDGESGRTCESGAGGVLPSADCSRTFSSAGRFRYYDPVSCTAYAGCGMTGLVIVDGPPVAVASAPASALRGAPITFDASKSSDPDGDTISSYQWDFHDGTTASGVQVQHAFTTAGHHDVTLTVTDSTASGATSVPIDISVPDSDGDGVNDDADRCPNNPGVGPDGCPMVVPVIPAPIATTATAAPELAVGGALRSGVTTVLSCSASCNAVFTLTRGSRSLGIPKTTSLTGAGSEVVTIKFTRAAKRTLTRVKNPRVILHVAVTDAFGRTQNKRRSVVLKPIKTYGKLPPIGISDNQPTTFTDPNFQVLKLRYARLVTPWNSIFTEPERLDAWLQAARSHRLRPLVSFEHARGMACPGRKCKGPSTGQYKRAWRAFHKQYPWVKDISPWNEVNSATQPTGKRPQQAAAYYNVVRAACRGCTIVAADLLDAPNIRRYVAAFLARAKGHPALWGLHNYTDTNRFRARGTQALLQSVHGKVWLTETGGVVRFVTQSGKVALRKSESRAKKAMDYMFRLAEQNSNRIKRIYVYQWKVNNVFDRFDAGVVRPNGTPRPSYDVLTLHASVANG